MRHDDDPTDEELADLLKQIDALSESRPAGEKPTRPSAKPSSPPAGEGRPRDDPPACGEANEPRFRRERKQKPTAGRRRRALAAGTAAAAVVLVSVALLSVMAAARGPGPEEQAPPPMPVRAVRAALPRQSFLDAVLEQDRMHREREARRFPRHRVKAPGPPEGVSQPRYEERTRLRLFVDRIFEAFRGIFN